MVEHEQSTIVGSLPNETTEPSRIPAALTWTVWLLWVLAIGALAAYQLTDGTPELAGLVAIDGLTVVMWVTVTFFSGIVHSYSRRYMAGDRDIERFYLCIFGFTLVVMTLVAANHVVLFVGAWLAMGLIMAELIGHVRNWTQAREAASLARNYFVTSSLILGASLALLFTLTGEATISAQIAAVDGASTTLVGIAAVGLVVAAIIQSALFPFHTWLLSSMTAPTPASALMHAGFVNAGAILLTRFAPVVSVELAVMSIIVIVGAISALFGQAMLLVQTDVKGELGSSTMAQMGFMIMQCGLGFFAAAIAHLILHGFYKAYLFLSAGATVEHESPSSHRRPEPELIGVTISLLTAIGGGALFMFLTGKADPLFLVGEAAAPSLDSAFILTIVVVLTTLTAARDIIHRSSIPTAVRYAAIPGIVLVAITGYGLAFNAVSTIVAGVPMAFAATELTIAHYIVVALFLGGYLVTELGWYRRSGRLYVWLLNRTQPGADTVLTTRTEYTK